MVQVNEKGQLRLSRRALIPDADPLVPSTKQNINAKSAPKKFTSVAKDGPVEENVELTKVKSNAPKATSKGNSEEDIVPPGKVVKSRPKTESKAISSASNES